MKNINYKIIKDKELFRIAFFECGWARLNYNKLNLQKFLNLSNIDFYDLLKNSNFINYQINGFYNYETSFKNEIDALKWIEIIKSHIIMKKLIS